jgi:hypothetical protein
MLRIGLKLIENVIFHKKKEHKNVSEKYKWRMFLWIRSRKV